MQRICVLFLAANPKNTSQLRLSEEVRTIDERLRASKFRDYFELIQSWAVRETDLAEALLRHKPHIVHFSGHGNSSGQIILENNTGEVKPVLPSALSDLFGILTDNIRCVVLNACFSYTQAEAIVRHIDCVVGMSRAIDDSSAIAFAGGFYRGIGWGRNLQTSFQLGCNEIDLNSLGEANTPQLLAKRDFTPSNLILLKTDNSSDTQKHGHIKDGSIDTASISSWEQLDQIKLEDLMQTGLIATHKSAYKTRDSTIADAEEYYWLMGVSAQYVRSAEAFLKYLPDYKRRMCKYRFLLLNPKSPYLEQHTRREGRSASVVAGVIRNSIDELKDFQSRNNLTIEIRLYDDLPVFRILIIDKKLCYVSFYGNLQGIDTPQMVFKKVTGEDVSFYSPFESLYELYWGKSVPLEKWEKEIDDPS